MILTRFSTKAIVAIQEVLVWRFKAKTAISKECLNVYVLLNQLLAFVYKFLKRIDVLWNFHIKNIDFTPKGSSGSYSCFAINT